MPLLLSASDIEAALPAAAAVDVLEEAFRLFASGAFTMPQRLVMAHPDGILAAMPAADRQAMGVKVVTVHRSNPSLRRLPAVQGLVLLLDAGTGEPLAILNGTVLTLVRTAAASGVATRHLALDGPAALGVIGSGPLAIHHIRTMAAVRPLTEVRMFSPHLAVRWDKVVRSLAGLDARLIRTGTAEAAVRGATLLVLVTSSASPVIDWSWVTPGTHINAVGSHAPAQRELDTETVVHGRVICDSVDACWTEAGDLLIAEQEGRINRLHARVGLGDIMRNPRLGRTSPADVTVFKSVGLAFQDLWTALAVWRRARDLGRGIAWDLDGAGGGQK